MIARPSLWAVDALAPQVEHRLTTRERKGHDAIDGLREEQAPGRREANQHATKPISCWLRVPRHMLCDEATADDGRHLHVNSGSRHISNTETRVSVILGVCRQDPYRGEFDAIYRPILATYLRIRGSSDSDANDVTQDVFVKLIRKIHTYDRTRCKFRSWLFNVAHNTVIDHARRRASYQKALHGWVVHALQATPSDSLEMAKGFADIHRRKFVEHALKTVRALPARPGHASNSACCVLVPASTSPET